MPDDSALKPERETVTLAGKPWIIEEPKRRQLRIALADIADIRDRYAHLFGADGKPRGDAKQGDMARCVDAMIDLVLYVTGAPEWVGEEVTELEAGMAYSAVVNFILRLSKREGLVKTTEEKEIPVESPASSGG